MPLSQRLIRRSRVGKTVSVRPRIAYRMRGPQWDRAATVPLQERHQAGPKKRYGVRSLKLNQAPRPRTPRVQHPATAGERAGMCRPVHPREDAQSRRHSANARRPHCEAVICTELRQRISLNRQDDSDPNSPRGSQNAGVYGDVDYGLSLLAGTLTGSTSTPPELRPRTRPSAERTGADANATAAAGCSVNAQATDPAMVPPMRRNDSV
jgi:hypothetical protein